MTVQIGAVSVTHVGDDDYRIDCARCGERVTYRFQAFTMVEAERHERWCSEHKQVGSSLTPPWTRS